MTTHRWLAHFGSLRNTLVLLALFGAVVLAGSVADVAIAWAIALVMALLAVNLVSALVVHPAFRRQLPLLVAHLALLAVAALAGLGRLLALDGRFEVTEGVVFDGRLIDGQRGALHRDGLHRLAFRNDGFEIDYAPGRRRGPTRNQVSWLDDRGQPQTAVIGDHRPLVLDGHRIYTTPNKGFAPVLRWSPRRGEPVLGSVHLPSFPMHELRQSRDWALPDGRRVWVQLEFDEALIDPDSAASFGLPRVHRLVVRVGEQRFEIAPGSAADLGGGTLAYEGLRSWMGYRVSYDPTLPWLLAAALLASLALAWHYATKFAAPPQPVAARRPRQQGAFDV